MKRLLPILLTLILSLSGCTLYDHMTVTDLTLTVTAEDIAQLEDYRKLTSVDLTGSTCYAQIEEYKAAHPEVEVTYAVRLLEDWYAPDTAALDLSGMTAGQMEDVLATLQWLPQVTEIELMAADGSTQLSLTDVKQLRDALPGVTLHYEFDLFGQRLSLTTQRVEYVDQEIGDQGEERIRQALDLMTDCTYFKLDNCGLSNEVMAGIRDDYPDTKIVWRVWYGVNNRFCALTDETVVRSSHYLTDDTIENMKYLTDAIYVDVGHNDVLTDINFCAYMPNMKLLIASGAPVSDLSPLQGLQDLEFVELCFCGPLTDISPLADCPSLKYLNIAYTNVSDVSPVNHLPLERLMAMHAELSYDTLTQWTAEHPDCITVSKGKQPYGYGWRYIDDGYTFWDYYATMREIFHYDQQALLNGYEFDEVTKNDPW